MSVMAAPKFLNVFALVAIGSAAAWTKRDEVKRTEAWARADAALHVLRGRPLVWRVNLVAPPVINLAGGQDNVRINGVNLDGATCLKANR